MKSNYIFFAMVRVSRTILYAGKVFVRHEHRQSDSYNMLIHQQAINAQQSYYKQAYTQMVFAAKESL